jgi:hypothetical protein
MLNFSFVAVVRSIIFDPHGDARDELLTQNIGHYRCLLV